MSSYLSRYAIVTQIPCACQAQAVLILHVRYNCNESTLKNYIRVCMAGMLVKECALPQSYVEVKWQHEVLLLAFKLG